MKVAFVQFSSDRNGSAISGKMIVEGFVEKGWEVLTVFAHEGCMQDAYVKSGSEVVTIPHKSWLRTEHALRSMKIWYEHRRTEPSFVQQFKEWKPDLVYINTLVSASAARAAHTLHIPVVWHIRELFHPDGGEMKVAGQRGVSRARRLVDGLADKVVVISRFAGETVLGPSIPYRVIPNAVESSFLLEPPEEVKPFETIAGVPVIGVPGTLRRVKGHAFLLEALHGLPGAWQCVITGEGEASYREELIQQVDALGLTDRVQFVGSLDNMPAFYRACNLICVPSRSESFGRTVIEAFAMQKPVVASDVGGMREIIRPDETGKLVPFGDAEALRKALEVLLGDPEMCRRFSAAAFEEVQTQFDETAYHRAVCEVAEQAVSGVAR